MDLEIRRLLLSQETRDFFADILVSATINIANRKGEEHAAEARKTQQLLDTNFLQPAPVEMEQSGGVAASDGPSSSSREGTNLVAAPAVEPMSEQDTHPSSPIDVGTNQDVSSNEQEDAEATTTAESESEDEEQASSDEE